MQTLNFQDGKPLSNAYNKRFKSFDSNQKMIFNETTKNDEGTYVCRAENRMGRQEKQFILKFKSKLKHLFANETLSILNFYCCRQGKTGSDFHNNHNNTFIFIMRLIRYFDRQMCKRKGKQ